MYILAGACDGAIGVDMEAKRTSGFVADPGPQVNIILLLLLIACETLFQVRWLYATMGLPPVCQLYKNEKVSRFTNIM